MPRLPRAAVCAAVLAFACVVPALAEAAPPPASSSPALRTVAQIAGHHLPRGRAARLPRKVVRVARAGGRARQAVRSRRDTTGPVVTWTAPAAGSTVGGRVTFTLTATDATGVARVAVAVDGLTLFTDTAAPWGDAGTWDTATYANGAHRLTVTATDRAGNRTTLSRSVTVYNAPAPPPPPAPAAGRILWGAWIDGDRWGYGDAPWDARTIAKFESQAGRGLSIIHWGQAWYQGGVAQPFYPNDFDAVRTHGSIPLIDWNAWDLNAGGTADQPNFQLSDIISGRYDAYIRSWATGAKNWGKPLFLRFNHEMNGTWYPWSEGANGNRAGEYVTAWRRVRDIFTSVGATNVSWVWSPNVEYPGSIALAGLYPGDAYVDWVAMDGYNWGTNPIQPSGWVTFAQVFGPTYDRLGAIAPGKPVMIAETGSSEWGGSKAAWIRDGLTTLPTAFPRVRALLWFDWNDGGMDWTLESSASSIAAFAAALDAPVYAGNEFAAYGTSPIAPLV